MWAEYKAGDKSKRTVAKPGVLGCGYMLGPGEERENRDTGEIEATGLLGYAWNMGVKLTSELSQPVREGVARHVRGRRRILVGD
jgi:DNA polymerase